MVKLGYMKATLTFDTKEEEYEFKHALRGSNYHAALLDISNHLRSLTKYPLDSFSEQTNEELEKLRSKFFDILQDNEADLF